MQTVFFPLSDDLEYVNIVLIDVANVLNEIPFMENLKRSIHRYIKKEVGDVDYLRVGYIDISNIVKEADKILSEIEVEIGQLGLSHVIFNDKKDSTWLTILEYEFQREGKRISWYNSYVLYSETTSDAIYMSKAGITEIRNL